MTPDATIAAIDGAIRDHGTSGDAMRWVPEERRTSRSPDHPGPRPGGAPHAVVIIWTDSGAEIIQGIIPEPGESSIEGALDVRTDAEEIPDYTFRRYVPGNRHIRIELSGQPGPIDLERLTQAVEHLQAARQETATFITRMEDAE